MNWKIIQTDPDEYLLLSDSNTIKKVKGNNATDIITVLKHYQNNSVIPKELNFDEEHLDNIQEWLEYNTFLKTPDLIKTSINIVGEFGNDEILLNNFISNLPLNVEAKKFYNLSKNIDFKDFDSSILTLLIAPFYYNKTSIKLLSELQQNSSSDFFQVELYNNGISLGPLMNYSKDTVCLNCIETRKIYNTSSPQIIVENLLQKEGDSITINNVLEIGDFEINKAFIYKELIKVIKNKDKNLYNKAVFIDFNQYENQNFAVLKTPNCKICNPIEIYNPL